mgnify:CR=1 FL=1
MRKMRITLTAEFNIPDNVVLHDDIFECEGVMFTPELSFDCTEFVPYIPEELLRFPNDINSIKEYEIENVFVESKVEIGRAHV